ncbi:MAG TPA: ATP-binding protein [Usitatibacteraceae bacterium]|nr:ATP-binding protein [Usitatibacteraceae bacterium]
MRILPQSLLARTALVIVAALVASQLVSVLLFRYYSQIPRNQLLAAGYLSHLKTIRAALETIPQGQHREFLVKLREERGIRVFPAERVQAAGEDAMEPAPALPAIRAARERLREQFGPDADIFVFRRPPRPGLGTDGKVPPPPVLVTRLPAGGAHYMVVFPQSRIVEPDFAMAWLGWGIFGGVLALAGAVFLVNRLNQPLQALAGAAREIGMGRRPKPVTEMGPEEVRSVAVAFNQMREDLARIDRERATFLAGLSHDVRTPLTRLRLGLEMLPADAATRAGLEQDIADVNTVVEQFMAFARDESAEALVQTRLAEVIHASAERARRMGADVTEEVDAEASIPARPLALGRLVDNLLDNARKHAGTPITISLRRDQACWVLRVLDRGPGIPPDDVERLKQPFTRLDRARSGQSGAGLGLAIVERIAALHKARLELLPRAGGGTEVRLSFAGAGD